MMKWFYDLRISLKLIMSFLIIAGLGVLIGIMGLININDIVKADERLYQSNTLGIQHMGDVHGYYQRVKYNIAEIILLEDDSQKDNYVSTVNEYIKSLEDSLKSYEEAIDNEEDRKKFNELYSTWTSYKEYAEKALQFISLGKYDNAKETLLRGGDAVGDDLRNQFLELIDYNAEQGKRTSDNNQRIAQTASISMIIIIVVAVGISIILGLFIARIISNPIKKLMNVANQLALGDVNVTFDITSKDELGQLTEAFERMAENIRTQAMIAARIAEGDMSVEVPVRSENDLLGKKLYELVEKNNEVLAGIRGASQQVASAARQVSDSSIALSQGAAEQASSIEELTASIEEIAAQTKQNAAYANEANTIAAIAQDSAKQGDAQMKEMLRAMEEINESSTNISKIIKVIDEIAFQTNILALNAAVEAARAGQHGKGFAVVAEEVRNLAARSANAAKETTDMIESSIKKSEDGTKIANQTAESLREIIESIEKAALLVNDIAVSSNEQASGIEQINQGIMQVSNVVQNNSATSEESATASEQLSSQAQLLKELVAQYKLKKIHA